MAGRESLAEKAVSMCAKISELEAMLRTVNDYGDAFGFCEESDQILNDAHAQLGMVRARA